MMKIALAIAVSSALGMAGCSTVSNLVQGQKVTPAMVEQDAVQTCKFLPTDETAAALIENQVAPGSNSVASNTALAENLAQLICATVTGVTPASATKTVVLSAVMSRKMGVRRLTVPVLHGVPLVGQFITGQFVK